MNRLRSILYQLNQAVVDSKVFLSAHGKSGGRLFRIDSLNGIAPVVHIFLGLIKERKHKRA